MALLQLDVKKMEMTVRIGVLEEYKPDREVKRLFKKFNELKEESEEKIKKLTKSETSEDAGQVLKDNKYIQQKWVSYLTKEFNSKLQGILTSMNSKNEKICPGYKDQFKK